MRSTSSCFEWTPTFINAKAVVLATGDMSNNFDLLQYYSAQDLSKCETMGEGQHGDGHLMAEQTAHGRCGTVAEDWYGPEIYTKDSTVAYDA